MRSLPETWQNVLAGETSRLEEIARFVAEERRNSTVFPPDDQIFTALEMTPPEAVRVVLVGQDPYHDDGQAHGLSFSVPEGKKLPPSLRNIFKELASDLQISPPESGDLSCWAKQGVLLLNSTLTVRAHAAGSHRGHGWEVFTDAVLQAVNRVSPPCVFILWGSDAQKKRPLIDETRHRVLAGAHPSPLSAYRGFFGSRPFSQTNALLRELGREPILWVPEGAGNSLF
jgi:uracil-DNA glycosylase